VRDGREGRRRSGREERKAPLTHDPGSMPRRPRAPNWTRHELRKVADVPLWFVAAFEDRARRRAPTAGETASDRRAVFSGATPRAGGASGAVRTQAPEARGYSTRARARAESRPDDRD
jgi:hypothetical protein